jgi:DNA helicase HerA-like ATPase
MESLLIGRSAEGEASELKYSMLNRHGLICGATGTGKTITLQVLAEQFSEQGIPVILSDVKGDLSGIAEAGTNNSVIEERVKVNKLEDFNFKNLPCTFWDIYGESGVPLRTNISEMGPMLLSRVLDLNEVQTDIINVVFKYADDEKLKLVDIKDLKALLKVCAEQQDELRLEYGNIAPQSVAAIVRKIVTLEASGGDKFFTDPSLNIEHMVKTDSSGKGIINLIDARKLMHDKRLYSSFLLWILSEVFESFPEVGDVEKPKLIIFFDEAHLLFDDAPKFLVEKIETLVRLIRSKGVGLFFVTQSPTDLNSEILGQLGNKIQHGMRAASEKDRKLVKAISKNYPSKEDFDVEKTILELGVGESIVSCLNEKGVPQPVVKAIHRPPFTKIGPIDESKKTELFKSSLFYSLYEKSIDHESAYEILKKKKEEMEKEETKNTSSKKNSSNRQTATEAFFKSMVRTIGTQLGRQIVRGILGSIKR